MKLNRGIKYILIVVFSVFFIASLYKLYLTETVQRTESEEISLYNCTYEPQLGYQVFIKSNPVYEGNVIGEGLEYSKRILDYIEVTFGAALEGSQIADMDIQYEINAVVQSYDMLDDVKKVSWSKMFPLVAKETATLKDFNWASAKTIRVPIADYDKFAEDAVETTGIDNSNEVIIEMKGTADIHTEDGDISIPIDSNISIPLRTEVFSITKSDLTEVKKEITTVQESVVQVGEWETELYFMLTVICFLIIGFLLFLTREPAGEDLIELKVKKIIKNYGSRMVAVHHFSTQNFIQTYELYSVEDMIKIADEIQKPVFYIMEDRIKAGFRFYLTDEYTLYTYAVWSVEIKSVYTEIKKC